MAKLVRSLASPSRAAFDAEAIETLMIISGVGLLLSLLSVIYGIEQPMASGLAVML